MFNAVIFKFSRRTAEDIISGSGGDEWKVECSGKGRDKSPSHNWDNTHSLDIDYSTPEKSFIQCIMIVNFNLNCFKCYWPYQRVDSTVPSLPVILTIFLIRPRFFKN